MRFRRQQQIGELAKNMRPDRFKLETTRKRASAAFLGRDSEVIGPELNQPLGKMIGRLDGVGDPRAYRITNMGAQFAAGHAPYFLIAPAQFAVFGKLLCDWL